ncbi:MAG TPA: hypothetical protein VMB80_12670 [Candidatus Acidoferrum sp.]|nr:hypothetical protein [Candidatus Acidoferrum sp.]
MTALFSPPVPRAGLLLLLACAGCWISDAGTWVTAAEKPAPPPGYLLPVETCLDILMRDGTDHYGAVRAPILVSILDVDTYQCPSNPAALDQAWRVLRRERRNPAGANLLTDVPTLRTMNWLSQATDDPKYARFADEYIRWYTEHLVDERGFFWWGWHRHYDVFADKMTGHLGNPHEFHAIHEIPWAQLWAANSNAVRREIEAVWQWHVIDKQTGEVNRHGDGLRGCDFAMAAGGYACAFAFMYRQTGERVWLDRARLLADYFWDRRNPKTDLIADRPNAGPNRFDGSHFDTSITGFYCPALLKCFELTGDPRFRDQAVSYLKAYGRYGYDVKAGKFWGSLKMDGTPVPGPRLMMTNSTDKYATSSETEYWIYEPRGYLDLWQPYVAGYEHPIATAQAYAYAALTTGDPDLRATAGQFARWIRQEFPPRQCLTNAWYFGYAELYAPQGTYAGFYGQTVSFFLQMYLVTGDPAQLQNARDVADEAVARLYYHGLFRGHPAKPYYEAMDGVGQLLYALLELDRVLADPPQALVRKAIPLHGPIQAANLPVGNW